MMYGDKKQRILELYGSVHYSLIAKRVGCSREYVYMVLRDAGLIDKKESKAIKRASEILKTYLAKNPNPKVEKALQLLE
jgi:hypothetical protein